MADLFLGATPHSIGGPSEWFDGDDSTWEACLASQSAVFYTATPVAITAIRVKWSYGDLVPGFGAAGAFTLDGGSSATGPWTNVVTDGDPVTTAGATYPEDFEHTYTFAEATYQYWRFTSTSINNNDIKTLAGIGVAAGAFADWGGDGFDADPANDFGGDIESWTITRGASAEITGGATPGSARITLNNPSDDRYNPLNTSGPLYGLLTDGTAIWIGVNSDGALTGDDPRGLFAGRIRSITPKPQPGPAYAPKVEIVCEDALGWYRRTPCRVADALFRSHRDIREAVLTEIGETRTDLALEGHTVPLSGWDGDALGALEAINRANGTRHFVKPADETTTWYAYTTRNRQWRLDGTADYTIDAGTEHVTSDGWTLTADTVINQQRASVTPVIFTQGAIPVWQSEEVPFVVKSAAAKVLWVEFDDYVDAPTVTANSTGSALTPSIEAFGTSAKVTLTSAGTTTVKSLAVLGRLAKRLPTASVVIDDTTSQAGARGLRAGSDISGDFVGVMATAQGMAAHVVWRYGNPQFRPTLTITNWFPEMFEIDLFDTLAVTIDQLGMAARLFEVVGYTMTGVHAGTAAKFHTLTLVLQDSRTQSDPGWFTWDVSDWDEDLLAY